MLATEPAKVPLLDFLSGGGRMGERMRALDWSVTSLGVPESWPQSLRSALSICLGASFQIAIYWGEDLTLLYNDAWSPILGMKHPAALGQPARQVWPEIWDTIGPLFKKVLTTGEATRSQDSLLAMHRYGFTEECYFDYTFSPIRDEEGKVGGIFNAVVETTFRVIGERRSRLLRDLGERLAKVESTEEACAAMATTLETASLDLPFGVVYLPQAGTSNQALHQKVAVGFLAHSSSPDTLWQAASVCEERKSRLITGLAASELVDQARGPWPEPCDAALVVPFDISAQESGIFVAGLSPRLAPDVEYRAFVERIASAFSAALGRVKALEHERDRARSLAEIDRAKTAFFSNVSHEFRTPLTLMLGPLESVLAAPGLPSGSEKELRLAHRNAQRLLKLVNSLLDFTRIEAGRAQVRFEATDLAALTAELASTFRSAMQRAGLHFEVDCAPLPAPVFVDREMWEKIVLNLLSNAFKFTFEGEVAIRLIHQQHQAVLEVADSGIGVPQEELPRLFERFYRVENARGRTHEGSGIGLALVQELVHLHAGTIEAASTLGKGTTFRVRIPLGTAHLPQQPSSNTRALASTGTRPAIYAEEALRWLPEEASDSAEPFALVADSIDPAEPRLQATAGARILLADDNRDMREYVRRLLAPYYEITDVGDGRAALESAGSQPPDLVISDIMMPELDGFGLLKALRADPRTAPTPVILLSARAGEEATIEGLQAGADDYLVKPFSARELIARVAATLALARARAEAGEKLRLSEERFRAVQETSPDGFTLLEAIRDKGGRIVDFRWVYLNKAAANVARTTREALLGKRVLEEHPGNATTGLFETYCRVTQTGVPWIGEIHYQQDGLDAMVRLAVARVGDGVGVSTVDVSERFRAVQALKIADRQKDEFLAMLAHELRNPLSPIRNASELLARVISDNSQAHAMVGIIRRQVSHLSRLVDDLLDVSRITLKRIELQREVVEVAEIIRQAVESAEPMIRERQHDLQIHSSYRSLYVNGDVARLVQAVVNLLTNAAKYTERGGRIDVTSRESDGEVQIEVRDNGSGISPALLPRVFDLFVQSDRTLDRAQGGLGIGLSVVRRLLEMHGGDVSAQSAGPGQGSTFTIRLPLVQAPPAITSGTEGVHPKPQRILIVDDNEDAANTLAMMLRLDGHETLAAHSGSAALAGVSTFRPDVILLDIGLPGMDGYEVARRIRAQHGNERIRIVALTGYGQPEDRARAERGGFDRHLVKPVSAETLAQTLRHLQSQGISLSPKCST